MEQKLIITLEIVFVMFLIVSLVLICVNFYDIQEKKEYINDKQQGLLNQKESLSCWKGCIIYNNLVNASTAVSFRTYNECIEKCDEVLEE